MLVKMNVDKIIISLQNKLGRQRAAVDATEQHIAFLEDGKGPNPQTELTDAITPAKPAKK